MQNLSNFGLYFFNTGTNYVTIAEALGVSSTVVSAGLAADNVICLMYFITLFGVASKIPKETSVPEKEGTFGIF